MRDDISRIFSSLGLATPAEDGASGIAARTPISGEKLASLRPTTPEEADAAIAHARAAQRHWRNVPAPRRGELVRLFAERLRAHKRDLAILVTTETGKILEEGLGEVQEMIDVCDFAVGLSRQLYGLTIASERPDHRMFETWHPIGLCGVISAFNFPVAVWAWNAALALVCGNAVVWKPSEKAALSACAAEGLLRACLKTFDPDAVDVSQLLLGSAAVGEQMVLHPEVRLISATGSTTMGRTVGTACARSFKRTILELGGNNAAIVCPSADLALAVRAIAFSAVGTAGQRCTTLRRLFVQRTVYPEVVERLKAVYRSVTVGDPLETDTLVGPLIDADAYRAFRNALDRVRTEGGTVTGGEREMADRRPDAYYVRPALAEMPRQTPIMLQETFAPLLYVMAFDDLDEAIALNNAASHGLSSCIFTQNLRESEEFLSARGSDCGIANVNIGTSGAEIGGAFGGEKETGGGRESGSDAWKGYMRRVTTTINFGSTLPLAQGIRFDV